MLGSTVCAGGRLALRTSTRALARPLQHRDRLVVFQGPLDRLGTRQGVLNTRNYWWSKPVTLGTVNSTGLISQHTPEPVAQVTSATASQETVVSTAIPSDQIAQTNLTATEVLPTDVSVPASGMSEVVASAIQPLQYGDFAALGITNWWPSGIITWSFELLQVSTGMPWFYTIIAGSLFWRAIVIPAMLVGVRNAARLGPYSEEIKTLDERAKNVTDRAAQMEIMLKKQKVIEKAGVSVPSMFAPTIPVIGNLGLFFAIKGMVQLPVMQLTESGVWFLPDLTLAGGYVMPTLMLLLMNVQFSVMKKELDPTRVNMAHFMNITRVASFATLPMMSWMPCGLWLSMITGLLLGITQSTLLKLPRIRQALSIPPVVPTPPVTMRDTGKAILEWYRQKRMDIVASRAVDQRRPNWTTLPKASRRVR